MDLLTFASTHPWWAMAFWLTGWGGLAGVARALTAGTDRPKWR